MKLRDLEKKQTPALGSTRKKIKFALFPTRAGGALIWLEFYEVLEVWHEQAYVVTVEGQKQAFSRGHWIEISRRRGY
jgi:hypothetical protein